MSLFFSPLSPISTKPLSELPFLFFYLLYFSNTIATITIFFFLFPLSYFSKTIARIIIFFYLLCFGNTFDAITTFFFLFFPSPISTKPSRTTLFFYLLLFWQHHCHNYNFFFSPLPYLGKSIAIFSYFGNTITTITIFFFPLLSPILATPLSLLLFLSHPFSVKGNLFPIMRKKMGGNLLHFWSRAVFFWSQEGKKLGSNCGTKNAKFIFLSPLSSIASFSLLLFFSKIL